MSIIRTIRNGNFVTLDNNSLWNKNLSLKAIGLWARCLSRPNDWEFHVSELASTGKEKKLAIYNALDELIAENYVVRIERYEKNEKGRFSGKKFDYLFFNFPPTEEEKAQYIEEFKKSFRHRGFGDLHNQQLLKNNTYKEKKVYKEKPKKEKPSAIKASDTPSISKEEEKKREENLYHDLCEKYGRDTVIAKISQIKKYKGIKNKEETLIKWLEEDWEHSPQKRSMSNQDFYDNIRKNIDQQRCMRNNIHLGPSYIEETSGSHILARFKTDDKDFIENVTAFFRNRGYRIDDEAINE